jgi:hypothetical protein
MLAAPRRSAKAKAYRAVAPSAKAEACLAEREGG